MKKIFVIFSILFSILIFSCNVGLGSAVDTEAPVLSIDYPPTSSVIRDSFILKGSCSDDVKVAKVVVDLTKLGATPVKVDSFEAEINNEEGYWTLELNNFDANRNEYNGWKYSDGGYKVDVTAYDDSKRSSGTSSISFTIDNTPPLMILTTPGSGSEVAPSEYGTSIKVNGTIVDDNSVKSLVLKAYDKDGQVTVDENWTERNINTAGGTEVLFAKYSPIALFSDDLSTLNSRYDTLYPPMDGDEVRTGDMIYTLGFVVTDEAKAYKNPFGEEAKPEDELGNSTDQFFFYDDVVSTWSNDANQTDYKKVQQILNGTNTTITDETIIAEVKSVYENNKKTLATCLINKDATPKFSVLGYSVKPEYVGTPENLPAATGGGTIAIQAIMGRNKDAIIPRSLSVYQFGPFDSVSLDTVNEIYNDIVAAKEKYSAKYKVLTGDEDAETKKNASASSESYTYSVKVDSEIIAGKVYVIAASGKDTSVNSDNEQDYNLSNDGFYVFKAATSEVPPTIIWESTATPDVNSIADQGYSNNPASLVFGGQYASTSPIDESIEGTYFTVKIKGENKTVTPAVDTYKGPVILDKENNTWSINLKDAKDSDNKPLTKVNNSEFLYEITVTMKNDGGPNSNNHKIHIDTNPPELKISAITPTVENKDGKLCVNGKIQIQASISETALKTVYYKDSSYPADDEDNKDDLGKVYSVSKLIDTNIQKYKDCNKKDFVITLIAADEAGNETTVTSTMYNSGTALYLDQDTDRPQISPNNFTVIEPVAANKVLVKNDKNVFDAGSNNKINATITDDDGLKNIFVKFYNENGVQVGLDGKPTSNSIIIDAKETTTYTLNQPLPKEKGIYKVEISATDTDGNTSDVKICETYVGIDTSNPRIQETKANTEASQYVRKDNFYTFAGTVFDDWEIESAQVVISKLEDNNYNSVGTENISCANDNTWKYDFKAADHDNESAEYKLEFVVTDRAGKQNSINRYITIDTENPEILITVDGTKEQVNSNWVIKNKSGSIIAYDVSNAANKDNAQYWFNVNQIPVKASVSDNGSIASVEYSNNYNSQNNKGSWSSMAMGSDSSEWTSNAACANQGKNTIWFKVTDTAGNETITSVDVNIDTIEPDGVTWKSVNNGNSDTVFVKTNGSVVIQVKASDNGTVTDGSAKNATGIGDIYYGDIHATVDSNDVWTLTIGWTEIQKFPTDTTSIKIKIGDKVGNEMSEKVVTIQKDSTAPTGTVNIPADADDSTTGTQINKTVVLSGTASDNQTLRSVAVQYNTSSTNEDGWITIKKFTTDPAPETNADEKTVYSKNAAEIANWKTDFDTTELSGTYYIRALVEDSAGNLGTKDTDKDPAENMITVIVDQESDRPKIYLTNLTLATEEGKTNYLKSTKTLSGTVTDDDGVTSFAYKLNDAEDFTTVSLGGGGSWTIPVTNEGENTILFKIVDKGNTTFVSEDDDNKPKITDGTTTITEGSCELSFNLVNLHPDVKTITYSVYNSKTSQWSAYSSVLNKVGGIYTQFKVRLNAMSKNEIDKVTALFNGTEISFSCDDDTTSPSFDGTAAHYWTSEAVTVGTSASLTGSKVFEITTLDKAEMDTITSVNINIDNTKPDVSVNKPSVLIGSSETIRGTINEEAQLYYGISRYDADPAKVQPNSENANRTVKVDDQTVVLATKWTKIESEDSANNWYVYFDDETDTDHTNKLATYLTEKYLGITTEAAISAKENAFDTVTSLYFWIKAVDVCGNETYVSQKIDVDPQGERPSVVVSYPANNENGEAPTLGGTIRITGTANDNNEAKYVWIQIDSDGTSGFGKADLKKLFDNNYTIGEIAKNTQVKSTILTSLAETDAVKYGIMVPVKGAGWNLSINMNKEFNPVSDKATLNMTFYATDQDPDGRIHVSMPATQTVYIDARNPYVVVDSLYLVQYKNADGTVCTDGSVSTDANGIGARQKYSDGMSISGVWFLTGEFKDDDSGIKKITYNSKDKITVTGATYTGTTENKDAGVYFKPVSDSYSGNTIYHYAFQIPLGSSSVGSVGTSKAEMTIVENTDSNLFAEPAFSVVYDNKAPELTTSGTNSFIKMDSNVQNSNGFYTFGTIASENTQNGVPQSGVERIAFYFTRDLEYNLYNKSAATYNKHNPEAQKTRDLFDVMLYRSGTEEDDVDSGNTIIDYTTNSSLVKMNDIYWKKVDGKVSGTIFDYEGEADPNIHKKGIVKINGSIFLIDGITKSNDKNVITLSGDTGLGLSSEEIAAGGAEITAYFALCNVIDNPGEKNGSKLSTTHGYGYGYYEARDKIDDGDLITETFTNQGTDWIFDAAVNSKNLPDGPITVHIIAFDKAGNSSSYSYDGVVSNNAPRIAGMKIGTDENGDGKVTGTEFISTYTNIYGLGYDKNGNEMTNVTFPTQVSDNPVSLLTIKGNTVMKPEIVGGNGDISYIYSVYNHKEKQTWEETAEYTKPTAVVLGTGTTDDVMESKDIELPIQDFITIVNTKDQISDGQNKLFRFSFGDSTPGTSLNTGVSNNASISVIMDVAIREENKAQNWILPFYWNSSSDNSLFKESRDYGHIDLSKDLPSSFTSSGTGIYSKRPKVSGAIKVEGIARDDSLLKEIKVAFDKKFGAINANTQTTIASFSNGTWTLGQALASSTVDGKTVYSIPAVGWACEITQVTYGELISVGLITELPEGKKAEELVPENSQEYGHIVHWIMYVDSQKIDKMAQLNVKITATATDRGKPTLSGQTVSYTTNGAVVTNSSQAQSGGVDGSTALTAQKTTQLSGTYAMDIVPYVTGISTSLDALYEGSATVYSRTALGKYIVAEGEEITISGFNLSSDASVVINGKTLLVNSASNSNNSLGRIIKYTQDSKDYINIPSGDITVTVNSVVATNNINANEAKGSYGIADVTHMYNRTPNMVNNNILTDDISLDIWTFKTAANPRDGEILTPEMQIGPNGEVGFAFVNGNFYFNMAGPSVANQASTAADSTYASQRAYEGDYAPYYESALAFDASGRTFGISTNQDSNDNFSAYTSFYFGQRATNTDLYGPAAWNAKKAGNYQGGAYRRRLQSTTSSVTGGVQDTSVFRAMSPSLATSTGTNGTNIYIAFYDAVRKEIRYKYGTVGTVLEKKVSTDSTFANNRNITTVTTTTNHGLKVGDRITCDAANNGFMIGDARAATYVVNTVPSNTTFTIKGNCTGNFKSGNFISQVTDQLIDATGGWSTQNEIYAAADADGTTDKSVRTDLYSVVDKTSSTKTTAAVSIGVVPASVANKNNDVAIMAWFDGTNRKLKYAYEENPQRDDGSVDGGLFQNSPYANRVLESEAGYFVHLKVDAKGGIHIAYFTTIGGKLKYGYAPSYKDAFTIVTIDTFSLTANDIGLDVAFDAAGNCVPYISYLSGVQASKIAYPVKWSNKKPTLDGMISNAYTGNWEISTVPIMGFTTTNAYAKDKNTNAATVNSTRTNLVPKNDTICVGVNKNWSTGTLGAIQTYTTATSISGDDTDSNYSTRIGGNGTKNPALAFTIIADDSLQFAQKN